MNKIIDKFSKLKIQDKEIVLKHLYSSTHPDRFCSLLTTNNYFSIGGAMDNCTCNVPIEKFVDLNRENIILTNNSRNFISGIFIAPSGKFAFTFSKATFVSGDTEEDFDFVATKLGEKDLLKFIGNNFHSHVLKQDLNISLLQEERGNFYLKQYPVFPIIDLNIDDNYNDDFEAVDKKLFNILTTNRKSFSILHGLPGTGKTTYIKNLCYRLAKEDKEVVYLPSTITHMLSAPSFVSNLDLFKDKILVIEDAESILLDAGNRSQAIANILNITDGILSDIYNIHFIFTFNMDVRKIDQALVRKGRLNLKYEFKELTKEKVEKLAKKLNIDTPKLGTLAELYNTEENGTESKLSTKLGY